MIQSTPPSGEVLARVAGEHNAHRPARAIALSGFGGALHRYVPAFGAFVLGGVDPVAQSRGHSDG